MNKSSGALRTTRSITKARDKGGTTYSAKKAKEQLGTKVKNRTSQEGRKRNSDETIAAPAREDMVEPLEGNGLLEDPQSLHVTDTEDMKIIEREMDIEEPEEGTTENEQTKDMDLTDIRTPQANPYGDKEISQSEVEARERQAEVEQPPEVMTSLFQLTLKTAQKLKIRMDKIPGDSPKDKTKLVSKRMGLFSSYLGHTIRTVRGLPLIEIEFEDAEDAGAAAEIYFSKEEGSHFSYFIQDLPQPQSDQRSHKSRLVIVRDIPLETDTDLLEDILSKWGDIDRVEYRTVELWKTALVLYKSEKEAKRLADNWSIRFGKDALRILPGWEEREAVHARSKWVVKIANLPMGTKAFNIQEIQDFYGAKTLYIPRTLTNNPQRHAFMAFDQEEKYSKALNTSIQVDRFTLHIVHKDKKLCYKCGNLDHKVVHCEEAHHQKYRRERAKYIKETQDRIDKGESLTGPISYASVVKGNSIKAPAKEQDMTDIDQRLNKLELTIQSITTALTEIWDYIRNKEESQEEEEILQEDFMDETMRDGNSTPKLSSRDIRLERSPPLTTITDPRDMWNRQDNLERSMNQITNILDKVAAKLNLNQ